MKHTILCLASFAATLVAGEIQPGQVPAGAKWFLHADLDAMRATETGKAVLEQIEADHGAKLRALKRMFSVHLLNDLRDITLFGDGRKDHAVALFDGTFDREHLTDLLKAAEGYGESSHGGITIHTWKDKKHTQHAAFATPKLLVFSRQENLLKEQLDQLKAGTPPAADPLLPSAGAKPLIAAGARLAEIDMPDDSARVLSQMGMMKISAEENGGRFTIRMDAETGDATRANRLRRLLDGMAALAEIGNPDLADGGFRAEVATTGKPGVSATLGMPLANWIEFMKKEAAKKRSAKKP